MAFRLISQSRNARVGLKQKRAYSTAPKFVANAGPAKVSSTKNGFRVVTEESPAGAGAAAVQLWVRAGSIYESAANNGVASLLVRLGVQAKAPELAKLGASLTGGVCREYSVYRAECLSKDVPAVVSSLGEIAAGLNFSDEVIEKERTLLADHAESLVNSWNQCTLTDHLLAAAYQGTAYDKSPSGTTRVIRGLNKSHLDAFRNAQYNGHNLVLSVAGASADNAETAFGSLAAGTPAAAVRPRIDFTGSQINVRDDTVHQAKVIIGYETVAYGHKDWAALQILQSLLGKWSKASGVHNNSSSRLTELLATEGLADNFVAFNKQYADTGLFGTYVETHAEDSLDDVIFEIFNEYQKIYQFLYEGELVRAKAQVIAAHLGALASPSGQAGSAGHQVSTFNRRINAAELVARVEAVSVCDIHALIDNYFNDVDPVVVAHGPLEEMPDYGILRSWTYWNRR